MNASGYTRFTATSIVIANMIGTGVFTSLGYQLVSIDSAFVLLLLWVVGGVIALCGAMCYAELGAAYPDSGGEYNFQTRIYHPAAGFIAGWISLTVGFAAPTALAAMTFASYLRALWGDSPPFDERWLAGALVTALAVVHAISQRASGGLQGVVTAVKVLVILVFSVAALWFADTPQALHLWPGAGDAGLIFSAGFAVSLIFVNYAYTGWNAAAYLSEELRDGARSLPAILIGGTLIVMVLYLLLNWVFLRTAPMDAMRGELEIGYIVARFAFEDEGARLMGVILALLLISTVSAMILAGPRVLHRMGRDIPAFSALGRTNRGGVPVVAITLQSVITLVLILSSSFAPVMLFSGFILSLTTTVTVAGVMVSRWRHPHLVRPFKVPLYPWPVLVFLVLMISTLVYVVQAQPVETLWGAGLVASGGLIWWLTQRSGTHRG